MAASICAASAQSGDFGYDETVNYIDYGFNLSAAVNVTGIGVHANAAPAEMKKSSLSYTFDIDKVGKVTRYAPVRSNITPYNYSWFPVSYHMGKGVMFGNGTVTNLNLRFVGIGLLYGINETPTEAQIGTLGKLVAAITRVHPELSIVTTQSAACGYRVNGTVVGNETGWYLVENGLIANAWNLPTWNLASQLEKNGYDCKIVFGYNRNGKDRWPVEYIAAEDYLVPDGFAAIEIS